METVATVLFIFTVVGLVTFVAAGFVFGLARALRQGRSSSAESAPGIHVPPTGAPLLR